MHRRLGGNNTYIGNYSTLANKLFRILDTDGGDT
jgi:hypothetical protein